ncbi:MAG: hypothetical protein ABJD11_18680, partial [Gemmatimonadota bacterium]
FLSGLYFRGKLAYAERFADPPAGMSGAQVITANRGLVPAETVVTVDELRAFGQVDIDAEDPRYLRPLEESLAPLVADRSLQVVLLGSLATPKYILPLFAALGERVLFPSEFVGRGDMSRGAMLLRAAREGRPLEYLPLVDPVQPGERAPRKRKKSPVPSDSG